MVLDELCSLLALRQFGSSAKSDSVLLFFQSLRVCRSPTVIHGAGAQSQFKSVEAQLMKAQAANAAQSTALKASNEKASQRLQAVLDEHAAKTQAMECALAAARRTTAAEAAHIEEVQQQLQAQLEEVQSMQRRHEALQTAFEDRAVALRAELVAEVEGHIEEALAKPLARIETVLDRKKAAAAAEHSHNHQAKVRFLPMHSVLRPLPEAQTVLNGGGAANMRASAGANANSHQSMHAHDQADCFKHS